MRVRLALFALLFVLPVNSSQADPNREKEFRKIVTEVSSRYAKNFAQIESKNNLSEGMLGCVLSNIHRDSSDLIRREFRERRKNIRREEVFKGLLEAGLAVAMVRIADSKTLGLQGSQGVSEFLRNFGFFYFGTRSATHLFQADPRTVALVTAILGLGENDMGGSSPFSPAGKALYGVARPLGLGPFVTSANQNDNLKNSSDLRHGLLSASGAIVAGLTLMGDDKNARAYFRVVESVAKELGGGRKIKSLSASIQKSKAECERELSTNSAPPTSASGAAGGASFEAHE
jgi:hypothetical protein